MRFNLESLITDLGGPSRVAQKLGIARSTPYRWIEQGKFSTAWLERIKAAFPHIDVDSYFRP